MKAVDEAAPEPTDVLVHRAGGRWRVRRSKCSAATYGRRFVVVAGKGNNGADGRDAAARLRRRGVRVQVIEAGDASSELPDADLVVDAAYGTGFHGDYQAPDPGAAPVLAVDIPSGVNGSPVKRRGRRACRPDGDVRGVKAGPVAGRRPKP